LLTEQLSQPTNLGFMVLVGGLCLAAMPARRSVLAAEPTARAKESLHRTVRFESQFPQ
jgi:hypothetical protein